MKSRFYFLLRYFSFWLLYFIGARSLFLVYHNRLSLETSLADVWGTFGYGLRLDASFAAYLTLLPSLLATASVWLPTKPFRKLTTGYNVFVLFLCTTLVVIDLEIFAAWGIRLDATPLMYLTTPSEIFASAYSSPLLLLLVLFIGSFSFWFWVQELLLKLKIANLDDYSIKQKVTYTFFLILLTASLIIPIRGGLQSLPINQSSAYFSKSIFANKAAINVCWNFFHAVTERSYDKQNPYVVETDTQKNAKKFRALYTQTTQQEQILTTTRPNVIIIIWESLTSKLLGKATPNLMKTMAESYYWDNIYATGSRSDKGIVGVLSGYPAQPQKSIIIYPNKSRKMPLLGKDMRKIDYKTAFYYGGELEFVNMKSYLFECFDAVYGIDNFAAKDRNSKWGAHDHVVLNRLLDDTPNDSPPFFKTIFTLSSHEPFEVPEVFKNFTEFEGFTEKESLFANSHRYSDWAVAQFLEKAKQKTWWDNTVILIVADHGHHFPAYKNPEDYFDFEDFKIPLLITGGALKPEYRGKVSHQIGSQTDLAKTLLAQMALPTQDYTFSRNLLAPNPNPFAIYAYSDGIGYISDKERFIFDNNAKQVIKSFEGNQRSIPSDSLLKVARSHLQWTFQDFLDK